jgi:hypothetical protein
MTKMEKKRDKQFINHDNDNRFGVNNEINNPQTSEIEELRIENNKLKIQLFERADAELKVLSDYKALMQEIEDLKNNYDVNFKEQTFEIEQKSQQYRTSFIRQKEMVTKLEEELNATKKSLNQLKKQYNALKGSKLGKLTLKYWQWKKK